MPDERKGSISGVVDRWYCGFALMTVGSARLLLDFMSDSDRFHAVYARILYIPMKAIQQLGKLEQLIESTWAAARIPARNGKSAYVVAEHGLIGLTKVAPLENADVGVIAKVICPE